jgi:hypothetical protein
MEKFGMSGGFVATHSLRMRAVRTGTLAIAASLLLPGMQACSGRAPQPSPSPVAQEQTPLPGVSAPAGYVPPVETAPAGQAMAPAAPTPQLSATAAASPSADPAEAERAEYEKKVRAQVAAAKAEADSMTATANSECPDLKPGELRHPSAVGRCEHMHSQAAQAVRTYEALKKEARDAGIAVQ